MDAHDSLVVNVYFDTLQRVVFALFKPLSFERFVQFSEQNV